MGNTPIPQEELMEFVGIIDSVLNGICEQTGINTMMLTSIMVGRLAAMNFEEGNTERFIQLMKNVAEDVAKYAEEKTKEMH
jgi:hypothetical protein